MREQDKLSDAKRVLFDRYLQGKIVSKSNIQRRSRTTAPLSFVQEQLYIREQELQGKPAIYNECIRMRVRGSIDSNVLERSFNEILRRHEVWRTSFETKAGQPVQVIHPASPIEFTKIDLRGLNETDREAEALRLVSKCARLPFQLGNDCLLRPILVRTSEQEHCLFLVAHQIVLDGRSAYQIYPYELASHYKTFLRGQKSSLPELPIQCADFAWWQRDWWTDHNSAQFDYWRHQLAGPLPDPGWPIGERNTAAQPFIGRIRPFAFTTQLSNEIRDLTKRLNTTLFLVLLTAVAVVIHRHMTGSALIVGTLSPSGRKRSEVTNLLGYFLNPVPLRFDFHDHRTFRELLSRSRHIVSEAMSNDDVPIEHVAQSLGYTNRPGLTPFFNVVVSLQPPAEELDLPWSITSMDVESGGSPWPLYLAFIDRPQGIIGRMQWNPGLVEISTLEHLINELEETLRLVCSEL